MFRIIEDEMHESECLRLIEEQANRPRAGSPAGCESRHDGVSRLLGGDLCLRQMLQVELSFGHKQSKGGSFHELQYSVCPKLSITDS